ncbi:SymE family type I addiction module toxin [Brenneria goodwinii]|nr:SymE family type I addiction module toxin [Brenneria goodwinii]MCG8159753.1 SymE family type I addiction module toxin [Brenneria goodwinii]MCG8165843.1 SymE family type I addiction module toxin [Brenneria goodwinii]MCG8170196.1 SymE family type I addiction module toxin [Brenneria goodwinii]MCG8173612.1 SymE family type I addiction module toxin [Brenneria goodwinii]
MSFKADNLIFPDKDAGEFLRYYSRSPSQHLKGHWLEAAGFGTETVEHGQLLIRIVAE